MSEKIHGVWKVKDLIQWPGMLKAKTDLSNDFERHVMKVIRETCRAHYIIYLLSLITEK